ncbi:DYNLRB [Lepeophtheirus salmonis]|uniref:DYNLRB n=1 Tax=Lepeophtheirus salmonis TaxID=72036 RepID=A0A7R8CML1_LEPSM|nr:dynein light chain roadblock-type 2-like [Lepeophtheirus salmonis]CAB4060510.1 DYNLRB [Lepeophtheirus salmonis]CAF2866880.1 DYNLRB [Lepeophtheirus salmonis]
MSSPSHYKESLYSDDPTSNKRRPIVQKKSKISVSDKLDGIFKRILSNGNVEGLVLLNSEGIPLKTTLESGLTIKYATMTSLLAQRSKSIVRDLDPTNELTYIRIKSKKYEILMAPDDDYLILVIQNFGNES